MQVDNSGRGMTVMANEGTEASGHVSEHAAIEHRHVDEHAALYSRHLAAHEGVYARHRDQRARLADESTSSIMSGPPIRWCRGERRSPHGTPGNISNWRSGTQSNSPGSTCATPGAGRLDRRHVTELISQERRHAEEDRG